MIFPQSPIPQTGNRRQYTTRQLQITILQLIPMPTVSRVIGQKLAAAIKIHPIPGIHIGVAQHRRLGGRPKIACISN
jgi:hypothetical protein